MLSVASVSLPPNVLSTVSALPRDLVNAAVQVGVLVTTSNLAVSMGAVVLVG